MSSVTLPDITRIWNDARTAIVQQRPLRADWADLDTWRARAVAAPAELRVAAFVATCAMRLAIVDAANAADADDADPRAVTQPATTAEALSAIRAGARGWNLHSFDGWNGVAYAVCLSEAEEVLIDEPFLATCAAFEVKGLRPFKTPPQRGRAGGRAARARSVAPPRGPAAWPRRLGGLRGRLTPP
jgi:hypothetical protein